MNKRNQSINPFVKEDATTRTISWKPWIEVVLFALFASWILVGMNSDYFFTVQERSLFLANQIFFDEMMATPGGLLHWAGSYLTQFFYYPTLGASLLILIWLATYGVTIKAFRLNHTWSHLALIPITALLCSTIDLGYWLYQIKIPGYWFSESLAMLIVISGIWLGRTLRGTWGYIWLGVWIAGGYPILGWYALLGGILMAIIYIMESEKSGSQRFIPLIYVVTLVGIVPLLWYYHYNQNRLEDAWICGFPQFEVKDCTSWITLAPFFVMVAGCLILPFVLVLQNVIKGRMQTIIIRTIVITGCALVTWIANFSDYNYHAEMRMYRYAEEGKWQKILQEARECKDTPTRQMVILKNIALMNLGQMGNQMFQYDNGGKLLHTRDNLTTNLVHTAAPMLYYQHGMLNYCIRWCIENGVEYGFTVNDLKLLARCSLLGGEFNAAKKYINLLKLTTFHRKEAEKLEELYNRPENIYQSEEFKVVRELHRYVAENLDSDNGLCEMYLIHYCSNMTNNVSPLVQEVTLNYALISRNIQLFWPKFFKYAELHNGEEMPIHYQEAAYLYGNLEKSVNISQMPFDHKIIERYKKFNEMVQAYMRQGMTDKEVAEAVKPAFGNTFWWFYFFCNDVKTY
ncbi:MAG: hypothetical protein IKY31_05575 [Bacteroidaceae bacterium]|nr:hypothetical protein [Bacteroidaceae bacterium]